ncbi:gametogenetin-binding protein 2-like [Cryptotermes secundus]|uniref:gametogenetin-binding protein 2-like n=1 Tax=Cryptotermes secundus TaxID=105785 RepID=UPI000CD7AE08|nr:gametogenetin-binding protein 2-like [Cryptotermes secundus]
MAKLVDVYRAEKKPSISRRQLPLLIDENLAMVMDLNGMGLVCDSPMIRGKELDDFLRKFNVLTPSEMKSAFEVTCKDLLGILSQTVPCVGCRRSVERLFYQLMKSGYRALDPLFVSPEGVLSVCKAQLESPQVLCTLLHGHSSRLIDLVESQPRSKKSHRCNLHSLDSQRSRPITSAWVDVWECMRPQCKEEVVLIESSTLLTTLENYLRKHRFCGECRTKVLRAYTLLVEEPDPCREKGYVPALYLGIKRCIQEKHIHLQARTAYIANLITRAEPELMGSRRERHAKTLEIAQEEVLTCLGLCVYERLHRINLRLREEECTCQVLAAVAIEALCRNFEMAVEVKQGVSQLELLYEQITKEELAKQQRKEHKKQKRRKKKEKRAELEEKENNCECESEENAEPFSSCTCLDPKPALQNTDRHKLQVLDHKSKGSPTCYCEDCIQRKRDKGSLMGSVETEPNKAQRSSDKQQEQHKRKTGANCSPEEPASNNNSLLSNIRISSPTFPSSATPQQQLSLSPCQSCKNTQDLVETSAPLLNTNSSLKNCLHCNGNWSSSEHSQDCGYSSENNNGCCDTGSASSSLPSSPEGSEIACSDGFCNHEGECNGDQTCEPQTCDRARHGSSNLNLSTKGPGGLTLTLQQMLEESCSSDEECYIPIEEVQEFKARMLHVMEKRQELRQTLRKRFDELCVNPPQPRAHHSAHCASN